MGSRTLAAIAEAVGGTVRGDPSVWVDGVASVRDAGPTSITWITNSRYGADIPASRAAAILAPQEYGSTPMAAILCPHLDSAVAWVLDAFAPPIPAVNGVHPTAMVDASASLGANVGIGPYAVIAAGVVVGDGTTLHAGVRVGAHSRIGGCCRLWDGVVVRERCEIGDRVIIHPNSVIGGDGFGFFFKDGRHHKITHGGTVIIEDDVEIGACCCVDRAKLGATRIGRGTKIDNLVQIGHNARVGANCLLVAHASMAGSSTLGDGVVVAAYSAVLQHVTVGAGATVLGYTAVLKDVAAGAKVSGMPARDRGWRWRLEAALGKLPELLKQFQNLESRVRRLEPTADDREPG